MSSKSVSSIEEPVKPDLSDPVRRTFITPKPNLLSRIGTALFGSPSEDEPPRIIPAEEFRKNPLPNDPSPSFATQALNSVRSFLGSGNLPSHSTTIKTLVVDRPKKTIPKQPARNLPSTPNIEMQTFSPSQLPPVEPQSPKPAALQPAPQQPNRFTDKEVDDLFAMAKEPPSIPQVESDEISEPDSTDYTDGVIMAITPAAKPPNSFPPRLIQGQLVQWGGHQYRLTVTVSGNPDLTNNDVIAIVTGTLAKISANNNPLFHEGMQSLDLTFGQTDSVTATDRGATSTFQAPEFRQYSQALREGRIDSETQATLTKFYPSQSPVHRLPLTPFPHPSSRPFEKHPSHKN